MYLRVIYHNDNFPCQETEVVVRESDTKMHRYFPHGATIETLACRIPGSEKRLLIGKERALGRMGGDLHMKVFSADLYFKDGSFYIFKIWRQGLQYI